MRRRRQRLARALPMVALLTLWGCAMQGSSRRVDDGARIPLEVHFTAGDEGDVVATLPDGERIHGTYFATTDITRSDLPLDTPWGRIEDEGPDASDAVPRAVHDPLLVLSARGEAGTELRCVARPQSVVLAVGRCLDSEGRAYALRFQRAPVRLPGSGTALGPATGLDVLRPVP